MKNLLHPSNYFIKALEDIEFLVVEKKTLNDFSRQFQNSSVTIEICTNAVDFTGSLPYEKEKNPCSHCFYGDYPWKPFLLMATSPG